jgi:type I restriction enzyme M protein
MLAQELKSQVDKLWNLFWSGGIANPLTAIEQISYLIFMKRLDEEDLKRKSDAEWTKKKYESIFSSEKLRWSQWKHLEAEEMLKHVRDKVFPFIKKLNGESGNSFAHQMKDAVFIIPKASLLVEAVEIFDNLKITEQNQDTQGDIYEYLLSELSTSGKNGQFRTPRHIIKMMCALVNPKLGQTICDPACGTGGFLIGAYQHILKANTSPSHIKIEEDGTEHGLVGDRINDKKHWAFLKSKSFFGYDFDSTMLRIGTMNMVLHGIEHPNIDYMDTLSKRFKDENMYDVILANPPFKGSIDKGDVHEALTRAVKSTKTELLFVLQMERMLVNGGRCAVIVPDGVLFGSSNAHVAVRKHIVEQCQLECVISMPTGVFKPYAGVSTAVLVFTKGGETSKVWFYDMQADGFSLDDKRDKIKDNDIPDILEKWSKRQSLKSPDKSDKWFWVDKEKIAESKYDLNISKYKPTILKKESFEPPKVILSRITKLEDEIQTQLDSLKDFLV